MPGAGNECLKGVADDGGCNRNPINRYGPTGCARFSGSEKAMARRKLKSP